jgi:hypothetical protein
VARLDGHPHRGVEGVEGGGERTRVGPHVGRQLQEDRPELGAERVGP